MTERRTIAAIADDILVMINANACYEEVSCEMLRFMVMGPWKNGVGSQVDWA